MNETKKHGHGYQGIDFAAEDFDRFDSHIEYLSSFDSEVRLRSRDIVVYQSQAYFSSHMVSTLMATESARESAGSNLLEQLEMYALTSGIKSMRTEMTYACIEIMREGDDVEPETWNQVRESRSDILRIDDCVFYATRLVAKIMHKFAKNSLSEADEFFELFDGWAMDVTCPVENATIDFSEYVELQKNEDH